MLTIPTLDIGVTSRAFLQDHRRKSYLQPINWSVLSSGDTPYVEPMETDDNGGAPEPGGVYGTSSSHLIGGNSTHSLSRAEFHSLHLHLEESELLDEEEEDVGLLLILQHQYIVLPLVQDQQPKAGIEQSNQNI